MSKLTWDNIGERYYETGVHKTVVYPRNDVGAYPKGAAWNGVTAITESPSGAEPSPQYADNIKYLVLMSAEDYGATLEAFTYPEEFAECDGSAEIAPGVYVGQQDRRPFGLSYQTLLGNDTKQTGLGYKLHLVYGALAAPSEKSYSTVNESPEATPFSWEISTTPVEVPGKKPAAALTIDSTKVPAEKLKQLEDILYGTAGTEGSEGTEARLPLPEEVVSIIGAVAEAQG